MTQTPNEKGFFVQFPICLISGNPELTRDDKWVLLSLMQDHRTEGPFKLSFRTIATISGVPLSLLSSYKDKKGVFHEGIMPRIERVTGYVHCEQGKEIDPTTGKPKGNTQSYITINYTKIWQDNRTYSEVKKNRPVSNTNGFEPAHNEIKPVSYTNTSVPYTNGSVPYTNEPVSNSCSEVPPYITEDSNKILQMNEEEKGVRNVTATSSPSEISSSLTPSSTVSSFSPESQETQHIPAQQSSKIVAPSGQQDHAPIDGAHPGDDNDIEPDGRRHPTIAESPIAMLPHNDASQIPFAASTSGNVVQGHNDAHTEMFGEHGAGMAIRDNNQDEVAKDEKSTGDTPNDGLINVDEGKGGMVTHDASRVDSVHTDKNGLQGDENAPSSTIGEVKAQVDEAIVEVDAMRQILNGKPSVDEKTHSSSRTPKNAKKGAVSGNRTTETAKKPVQQRFDEIILSEKARAFWDEVWCKAPWFQDTTPNLNKTAAEHCEKVAKWKRQPTVEEVIHTRHWWARTTKLQGFALGNFTGAYPQWLSANYSERQVEPKPVVSIVVMNEREARDMAIDVVKRAKEYEHEIKAEAQPFENGAWRVHVEWNTRYVQAMKFRSMKQFERVFKDVVNTWHEEDARKVLVNG